MNGFNSRFVHTDDGWLDVGSRVGFDNNHEPQYQEVSTAEIVEEYDDLAEAYRRISIDLHVQTRRANVYLGQLQKTDPDYLLDSISDGGHTVSDGIEAEINCLVREREEFRFAHMKARAAVLPNAFLMLSNLHEPKLDWAGLPLTNCSYCGQSWPCQTNRILETCIEDIFAFVDGWMSRRLSL